MAAKKKKASKVPRSGEQKGAEAALYSAQQVGIEAQRQRSRQAAKGAFGGRQLRAGGTSLQQYNLAKFKSDPFPGLGGQTSLGAPGGGSASVAGGARSGARNADGRNRVKQQDKAKSENRRRDNMGGQNNAEKMQAQAEAKARAAAAAAKAKAAAKKKQQQKLTDSKGGNAKATGTKVVLS